MTCQLVNEHTLSSQVNFICIAVFTNTLFQSSSTEIHDVTVYNILMPYCPYLAVYSCATGCFAYGDDINNQTVDYIVFITLCECTVFMWIALDIFIVVVSCFY